MSFAVFGHPKFFLVTLQIESTVNDTNSQTFSIALLLFHFSRNACEVLRFIIDLAMG